MRFIVGYAADDQGHEALELGAWLAAQYDAELTVAYVVPDDFPIATMVDARESLPQEVRDRVDLWLANAREWLDAHADVRAETRVVPAASPTRGLIGLAYQLDARLIVLGSSRRSTGRHFSIGTVSGQLLHESPVPLALSPAGYEIAQDAAKGQVWCGYVGTEASNDALALAAQVAGTAQVPLRLVNFEVTKAPKVSAGVGVESIVTEDADVPEVAADTAQAVEDLSATGLDVDAVVARGKNVKQAFNALLAQRDEQLRELGAAGANDILVVGSHRSGPLSRVFLGGMASRILRKSPWPVIAVPRGPADLTADTAEEGQA